ncbi:alpha/beta hydrolase [Teredinibacter purpureus]|uniref:alpha/beta hydrolase n=1 Tax=Teredinibacter purpureus TaxID=2731756 RepID=UPI000A7BD95C|nr:alpha/beta hydrolase [Teredinibacter purpureus]
MVRSLYTPFLLVIGLLGGCGGQQASERDPTQPSSEPATQVLSPSPTVELSPEPRLPNPTPNVTKVRIPWGTDNAQFGDLYLAADSQEPLPVVVMIHGGCWQSSYTLDLQEGLSFALAERHFAVWNIEYRRLGNGGEWPTMFEDVAAATDYVRHLAKHYPLNEDAVTAMGHSAGGHLALWLSARSTLSDNSPLYNENPLRIKGTLTLGGIGDLESGACGNSAEQIIHKSSLNPEEFSERLLSTSPMHMLPNGSSSILLSGSRDTIVPPAISENFSAAANAAGDTSEHLIIAGANHFYLIDETRIDINLLDDSLTRIISQ